MYTFSLIIDDNNWEPCGQIEKRGGMVRRNLFSPISPAQSLLFSNNKVGFVP
jgi:hypothetical protein